MSLGFVVFLHHGGYELDFRLGGQILPKGSIPVYVECVGVSIFLGTNSTPECYAEDDNATVFVGTRQHKWYNEESFGFTKKVAEARFQIALREMGILSDSDIKLVAKVPGCVKNALLYHRGDILLSLVQEGADVNSLVDGLTALDICIHFKADMKDGWGDLAEGFLRENGAKTSEELLSEASGLLES